MALASHALEPAQEAVCPGCRMALRGQLFRAWWAPAPTRAFGSERALEGDAVCFFHPRNRAALTCDICGRFLCTICDLPVGSRHLCPVCLSNGLGQQKLPEIVPRRVVWSRWSLWVGLLPLLLGLFFWPFMIVTGPSAVALALIGWKRPGSLVHGPQRWAAVTGIILGLVQLMVWFGFITMIAGARPK